MSSAVHALAGAQNSIAREIKKWGKDAEQRRDVSRQVTGRCAVIRGVDGPFRQSLVSERVWQDKLVLPPQAGGYRIGNPTPYYITIIGLGGSAVVCRSTAVQRQVYAAGVMYAGYIHEAPDGTRMLGIHLVAQALNAGLQDALSDRQSLRLDKDSLASATLALETAAAVAYRTVMARQKTLAEIWLNRYTSRLVIRHLRSSVKPDPDGRIPVRG